MSRCINKISFSLKTTFVLVIISLFFFSSCSVPQWAKPSKISKGNPVNAKERARKNVEEGLAAKRMGTVEEFSGICTFLCSKQAAFINGQSITVDGGTAPGLL